MTATVTQLATRTARPAVRKARPAKAAEPVVELPDLAAELENWDAALEAVGRVQATRRAYREGIAGFLRWHAANRTGEPVLDRKGAIGYLNSLSRAGLSQGTCRLRYAALKIFSAWLEREGLTDDDPLAGNKLSPPKMDQPEVPSITDQEYVALLRACRGNTFAAKRDEALVRLMGESALRAGECVGLELEGVDIAARSVAVRRAKGGKHRSVPVTPATAVALTRYIRLRKAHRLAAEPALFLGSQGKRLGYQGLARALKVRADAAGIDGFHCHRLRHTAASRMLDAGMQEASVMKVAGWSTRQMIQRYTGDTAARRAAQEFHALDLRV